MFIFHLHNEIKLQYIFNYFPNNTNKSGEHKYCVNLNFTFIHNVRKIGGQNLGEHDE